MVLYTISKNYYSREKWKAGTEIDTSTHVQAIISFFYFASVEAVQLPNLH